ncbi:MAG: fluoride efflux transporter CrcB [Gammaproteobacteria bacterium]|nr:MAG: fluoride efflux transporter CrcB [Gammaproteobacteria bacterium]
MTQWASIAGGGALGALLRYWVSTAVYGLLGRAFPWGTLAVNLIGSFLMGLLTVLLIERLESAPETRAFLLIGFLGAFTTFSTFSVETLLLIESGSWTRALTNIAASVAVCVLAAFLGVTLGRGIG